MNKQLSDSTCIASIFEIKKKVLFVYLTDFLGNNKFHYVYDDDYGYREIKSIIYESASLYKNIIVSLPILGTRFRKNERGRVYFRLVKDLGGGRIIYQTEDHEYDFETYLYKSKVDVAWQDSEKISLTIYEPETHHAFHEYIGNLTPPFHPIDVAQTITSVVRHKGFCRLLCSRGLPPSSQDIEKHLEWGSADNMPFTMVACSDILYILFISEHTKPIGDKEELHLEYAAIVSKYKRYSKLVGFKLAVLEVCTRWNLLMSCSAWNHYSEQQGDILDEKPIRLTKDEDWVHPEILVQSNQILVGREQ